MCMEDIQIGRRTADVTTSLRQSFQFGDQDILDLEIAANQNRVGIRVFGRFIFSYDSEAANFPPANGTVELWVDSVMAHTLPVVSTGTMVLALNIFNMNQLLRVETDGLLVQRKLILHPQIDELFPSDPADVFIDMAFTEYFLVDDYTAGKKYEQPANRLPLQPNPKGPTWPGGWKKTY